MILDIRGTNGSGKTWVVRQLLHRFENSILTHNGRHLGYHLKSIDCMVLGRYTETGGGCDGIKGGAVEVDTLVRRYAPQYANFVFEGLMISHLYERFHTLAEDLGNYTFLFLDTPATVCIKRVKERRLLKGNTKPFDHKKNLLPDYKRTRFRVRSRLEEAGHCVEMLSHKDPLKRVLELLNADS